MTGDAEQQQTDARTTGLPAMRPPDMGLRERKRLAAMNRIQRVALELFDRFGYAQVSVERIAAAAEVSPSSIYRYFGTKEQLVLWDEYDPVALQRIAAELRRLPALAAVRKVMVEMIELMVREDEQRVRQRISYMMQEPAIAAASAVQAHQMAELIVGLLAEGLHRPPDDLELHLIAHGFVGAVLGAMRHWYRVDFRVPLATAMDRLVTAFEEGFRLDPGPTPPTR